MATLIFLSEKFRGRTYEIVTRRTTVGRGAMNTLCIADDSVSERHCEIYDNGGDLIIRDLASRNGTVVNGELIQDAQRPLAPGQIVKFGAIEARLELSQARGETDSVTDVTAVHFHARTIGKTSPPTEAGDAKIRKS
jgi:pSer/pThr/pTyr-binding forkhead associated (FHA) protein